MYLFRRALLSDCKRQTSRLPSSGAFESLFRSSRNTFSQEATMSSPSPPVEGVTEQAAAEVLTTEAPSAQHPPPPHAEAAWEWFRGMGSPKYHVAPMVDQSELPFRQLCRRHGAHLGYTPMLHSRLFIEGEKYREEHFTTCPEDRPVLAQFCSNDPEHLLAAAEIVADRVDGVDLNLGCPQRIAKRGRYGAFLMDDLPLVESMVSTLAKELSVPVTVKIRMFPREDDPSMPDMERTVAYARMLENAGAYLVGIHGRTRDQKKAREIRANWDVIKAVKEALHVPVIGNGNIRNNKKDADDLMAYTGVDGVMSAEALLENPALYSRKHDPSSPATSLQRCELLLEYLELVKKYPTPMRMIRAHVHKLLGNWLQEHTDLRDVLNNRQEPGAENRRELLTLEKLIAMTTEMKARMQASGRDHAVPKLSARQLARMEKEEGLRQAMAEQKREEDAVAALGGSNGAPNAAATPPDVAVMQQQQQQSQVPSPCVQ